VSSGQRREREKDEVRTRILDAARELFVVEGLTSVTMRRIADRLEYTPGALYRHFPDKAALLQALVMADYTAFSQTFAVLTRIADPLERIRRAGQGYIRFGLTHPHHYQLLFMTPNPDGAAVAPVIDPRTDAYELLHRSVVEAAEAGQLRPELLRDLEAVTRLLWAGVHGVVSLAIARQTTWAPRSVRPLAMLMLEILIRGIGAEKPVKKLERKRR
jgi:AcrR family transcriptional regulator